MTMEPKIALRLQFLARVVRKECKHLATTDLRLFGGLFAGREISARIYSAEDFHKRRERGEHFIINVMSGPLTP